MVEALLHAVVPFTLVALLRFRWRGAILASIAGLAPDVDLLLGTHRSATHSLLVLASMGLAAFLIARSLKAHAIGAAILLGALSHLVLDLGAPLPLLWPVVRSHVVLDIGLDLRAASGLQMVPRLDVRWLDAASEPSEAIFQAPVFTTDGLLIALVLAIAAVFRLRKPR